METPLWYFIKYGTSRPVDAYRNLYETYKISNEKDENGKTILHYFVDYFLEYGLVFDHEKDFLDMIIHYEKDVNIQDDDGNTVLHILGDYGNIYRESIKLVHYFIEKGANISIKNNEGEYPKVYF